MPVGQQRTEHEADHQRQPVHHLPAVARGRNQERHRRQEQQRAREQRRQSGREIIADEAERRRRAHIAGRQAVAERDAALARHCRQQTQRFHPHAHRREVRRQQKIAQARARAPQQRQQRHHHGKQPDRAQAYRDRHLDQARRQCRARTPGSPAPAPPRPAGSTTRATRTSSRNHGRARRCRYRCRHSTRKNTEVHADFTPPKKAAALELKRPGADMGGTHLSHSAADGATSTHAAPA